jgi:hypothetical protein
MDDQKSSGTGCLIFLAIAVLVLLVACVAAFLSVGTRGEIKNDHRGALLRAPTTMRA